MKTIIICLLSILVFSGYMALTTNNVTKTNLPLASPEPVNVPIPATVNDPMNSLNEARAQLLEASKILEQIKQIKPEPYNDEIDEEDFDEDEELKQEPLSYDFSNYSIEEEIAHIFGEERILALAIAKAESGLNPEAINRNKDGSKDIGIFQINDCHGWSEKERLDWRKNISMAKELRDRRGWGEWVVYNNGTYRNFL